MIGGTIPAAPEIDADIPRVAVIVHAGPQIVADGEGRAEVEAVGVTIPETEEEALVLAHRAAAAAAQALPLVKEEDDDEEGGGRIDPTAEDNRHWLPQAEGTEIDMPGAPAGCLHAHHRKTNHECLDKRPK